MNIVNETEWQVGLALVYGIAALNTYPVSSKDYPVLLRRDARNGTVAAGLTCAGGYCTHVCGQESKVDATWRHVYADASHSCTAPQPTLGRSRAIAHAAPQPQRNCRVKQVLIIYNHFFQIGAS